MFEFLNLRFILLCSNRDDQSCHCRLMEDYLSVAGMAERHRLGLSEERGYLRGDEISV